MIARFVRRYNLSGDRKYHCTVHPKNGFNEPHPNWECGIPMLPERCPICGQSVVQTFPVETVTINVTAILAGAHSVRKMEVGRVILYCESAQRSFEAPICREHFVEVPDVTEIEG